MKKYIARKGQHQFTRLGLPVVPAIRRNISLMRWRVRFDESAAYVLPMPDAKDWNKGGGLSFHLLTNHKNAAMWAWRWNSSAQRIQFNAYCHIDGRRPILITNPYQQAQGLKDGEVCFEAKPREVVEITLRVDNAKKRYDFDFRKEGSEKAWRIGVAYLEIGKWSRTIGPWFGGNMEAPQRICMEIERRIS